ncbi:MAG: hypothetical protein GC164_04725 [Phycisphaera sp.]|nr:hypothetical protein [Phycisphaera sp.]
MTTPQTYKAAVIGCGKPERGGASKLAGGFRIGYTHGQMYKGVGATRLVAAVDINAENLAAYTRHFEVPQGFDDTHKMLESVRPDLVSICTYVGLHRQMIEACANAGVRGILCEKPFVSSPADLAAVKAVCEKTGCKLVICHQRRMNPTFERARELYNNGTVGQRAMCIAGIPDWDLSEWGSHWLDMFRFFHNDDPVEWVLGQFRVRDTRAFGHAMEDFGVAYFKFKDTGYGLVDAGHKPNAAKPYTMKLIGGEGVINIVGEGELVIDTPSGRTREKQPESNRFPGDQILMLNDLIRWIEGGPVARLGLPNTYGSSELNLAAYLSAVVGDRVDLPFSDELLKYHEWPVEELQRRFKAKST